MRDACRRQLSKCCYLDLGSWFASFGGDEANQGTGATRREVSLVASRDTDQVSQQVDEVEREHHVPYWSQ